MEKLIPDDAMTIETSEFVNIFFFFNLRSVPLIRPWSSIEISVSDTTRETLRECFKVLRLTGAGDVNMLMGRA